MKNRYFFGRTGKDLEKLARVDKGWKETKMSEERDWKGLGRVEMITKSWVGLRKVEKSWDFLK